MKDRPALRADKAIRDALVGVARHDLAAAIEILDDQTRDEAVAVHDVRKAMKRWRAMLRLLEPFLGDEGRLLRINARDLARGLSSARDLTAALDALDDLGLAAGGFSARSIATIRGRIEGLRGAAQNQALTEAMRRNLRATFATAAANAEHWALGGLEFPALAQRLGDTYRRARRAVPEEWDEASAEELHELRQRVVAHRYQMELVNPLWPKFGKLWVGEAQKLRDRLGAYQDLVVLTQFLAPHQPLAHWRARLAPLIAARQGKHLVASRRLAGRLFAEKPKAFRRRLESLWDSAEEGED